MAENDTVTGGNEADDYVKPNPQDNPRNISLGEIAKRVAEQHKVDAQETAPSVDDEGKVVEPPPAIEEPAQEESAAEADADATTSSEGSTEQTQAEAPAAVPEGEEAIDPKKEYELTVDGQKIKVPGQKIIDAGKRTFQKETAADFRLNVATKLMEEAERRLQASQPAPEKPAEQPAPLEMSDADLAKALQFGTAEEAAAATKALRNRGLDANQIAGLVQQQSRAAARDELAFQEASRFVQDEYKDLLSKDHLKRLFYAEEQRYRTPKERGGLGDNRPYKDVYKDIGESIRKDFGIPKPSTATSSTSTAKGRQEVKAKIAPVPRTAAARLQEQSAEKPKTAGEIIAGMAAARGKNRLTPIRKE